MKPKTPKAGGKLPKWVIPVGIAATLVLILALRKKASAGSANATEPGTQGLSNQSFIPVTGENVPGVGAGAYGNNDEGMLARLFEQSEENNKAFQEYIRESNLQTSANAREQSEQDRTFYGELFRQLGTGGGAPSTGAPGGAVAAPPPVTAPASPSPAPPAPHECAPGFPFRGPHGCYRWSRTKSHDGCNCHGYQSGLLVCEHKVGGRCTF